VAHGDSVGAYESSIVGSNQSCQSETRVCDNGILSGSYTSSSCIAKDYTVILLEDFSDFEWSDSFELASSSGESHAPCTLQDVKIIDQELYAYHNFCNFRSRELISGAVRISFNLSKLGNNHHSCYDYAVRAYNFDVNILFDKINQCQENHEVKTGNICFNSGGFSTCYENVSNDGFIELNFNTNEVQILYTPKSGTEVSHTIRQSISITSASNFEIDLAGNGENSPRVIDNVLVESLEN